MATIDAYYEQFSTPDLAYLIQALRKLEEDGLRHTEAMQSYILRHISPQKLTELLMILDKPTGMKAVLAGVVVDEVSNDGN